MITEIIKVESRKFTVVFVLNITFLLDVPKMDWYIINYCNACECEGKYKYGKKGNVNEGNWQRFMGQKGKCRKEMKNFQQ